MKKINKKSKWILNNAASLNISGSAVANNFTLKKGEAFSNILVAHIEGKNTLIYGGNTTNANNASQLDTYIRGRHVYIQASGTGGAGSQKNVAIFYSNSMKLSGNLEVKGTIKSTSSVTATGFYESSDEKLKDNISEINYSTTIPFKQFTFKSDETKTIKYGVIAQDIEKIGLSNLVTEDKDGIKSVDYISLLCFTVNKLQKEVEELKNKLNK